MIQLSRTAFDVATDASGAKGIGGVHRRIVFSERIPSRHKSKKIDWKEMFAVLHAFMLWHEEWKGGKVRLACDNSSVVDALNKHSIRGPAIVPLQRIFLIAAVYDIHILPFWIPSEENMVADAASRFDYEKLANLGFQVSHDLPRPSLLRQKLNSFFTTPSLRTLVETMKKSSKPTSLSVKSIVIPPTHLPLKRYHTGLPKSYPLSNLQRQNPISALSSPFMCKLGDQPLHSKTNVSISSLEEGNEFMAKGQRQSDTLLHPIFSSAWSMKLATPKKESMSKRLSVWGLPPSYDQENLRGIHGPQIPIVFNSLENTLSSTLIQ
jgi:hypothetical protein